MKKISLILVLSLLISVVIIPVTVSAEAGNGTGLSAKYYNTKDLTGNYIDRIDQTVNFNWGYNSPGNNINSDNFSVEWRGQIQPLYSEEYTFHTNSDDGVRLWVNGQQLINNWTDHSATENSGIITLKAGQKYDIMLQYYDSTQAACISLSWKSNSQTKQIIPKTQLYPEIVPLAGNNPFDYAVFSGNSTTFNSSNYYVEGSVHSNGHMTVNGGVKVVGNIEAGDFTWNGTNVYQEKITGANFIQMFAPKSINDIINKNTDITYDGSQNFHSEVNTINKSVYIKGNATYDAGLVTSSAMIKAANNITFNNRFNSKCSDNEVCLYSEYGDIIIGGSSCDIYGTIYAPNGSVRFNSSNINIYGRVIAKDITFSGNVRIISSNETSESFKIVSGDGSGNDGVIAVKKDMQENLIDKEKVIKVVFSTESEIGKIKLNLVADSGFTLPKSVIVKNTDTGETYTATVDPNGCILIDRTLEKGNYEIPITFGITSDIKESAKVGFASKDSIILMDSKGTVVKKYDCEGSVQVRTLAAALSIDAEAAKYAVVRGASTKMIMDFKINSDNTDLNDIRFDATGSGTYKEGDITYKMTKITRVADNKIVWSGSGPLPSDLLKGAYKIELDTTFSGNIKDNTKWDIFIKSINITDDTSSNVSFGPFNSVRPVEVKIVPPPKMH